MGHIKHSGRIYVKQEPPLPYKGAGQHSLKFTAVDLAAALNLCHFVSKGWSHFRNCFLRAYVQHVQHHTVLFVEVGPTSTIGQGSKGSSTGGVSIAHCLAFPSKTTTSWVTDMGLLVWDALDTAT